MGGLNRIVCGWYTPDYAAWANRLRANLDQLGEPHDIVEVPKIRGGWERNTMRKPDMAFEAVLRHPGHVVIFLDVDCEVLRPLDELAGFRGDIAVHPRGRYLRDGTPRFSIRSGTIVIRPTPEALAFLHNWSALSNNASAGSVDQRTLPIALARTPGLTFQVLDNRYCAVSGDGVPDPVILHDSASRAFTKMPSWLRALNHMIANRSGIRSDPSGATRTRG